MILIFLINCQWNFPYWRYPFFLSIGSVGVYVKSIMDLNGPYLWVLILYQVPTNLWIAPFLTPEYTDDEFWYIMKEVMFVLYALLEFYVLKVIAMFYFVSFWSENNDFIFNFLTIYIFGIQWLGWAGIFWDFPTQSLVWLAFLCSRRFGNDNDCRNWHKTDNAPNYLCI